MNEMTSYKVRMKEFIMLIARRYELHYTKVYKYFESQLDFDITLVFPGIYFPF